jgi:hypothetical protein
LQWRRYSCNGAYLLSTTAAAQRYGVGLPQPGDPRPLATADRESIDCLAAIGPVWAATSALAMPGVEAGVEV